MRNSFPDNVIVSTSPLSFVIIVESHIYEQSVHPLQTLVEL